MNPPTNPPTSPTTSPTTATNPATSPTSGQTPSRTSRITRETRETRAEVELDLDGTGRTDITTGICFLDHLLTTLAVHARWNLRLSCHGDLHIDDHHSAEDSAITLGMALDEALGPREAIARFGSAYAPLDEALSRAVIDLAARPCATVDLGLRREMLGELATENVAHVLRSLATSARMTIHVDVLRGENDHHRAESAFKATALALRTAIARDATMRVSSTKGVLA